MREYRFKLGLGFIILKKRNSIYAGLFLKWSKSIPSVQTGPLNPDMVQSQKYVSSCWTQRPPNPQTPGRHWLGTLPAFQAPSPVLCSVRWQPNLTPLVYLAFRRGFFGGWKALDSMMRGDSTDFWTISTSARQPSYSRVDRKLFLNSFVLLKLYFWKKCDHCSSIKLSLLGLLSFRAQYDRLSE